MAGRAVSAVDYGQSIELVFPIMYRWPYHRRRHLLSQAPFHPSSSRIITHHSMHDDCIETIETIGELWFLVVPCGSLRDVCRIAASEHGDFGSRKTLGESTT